ncbi:MAG: hypothetical protein HOI23_19160 [Deltaproteobacteria bacterium]|jgi:hypothetical protein|nr:hypothetical protein [Deltaproteobacteria bacterium]MBT6431445.1 hypothetical protein [Deltaproteobacteria bacterium]MBT6492654.1 hypothetical protein [Deltaproteobacteria bacterium]
MGYYDHYATHSIDQPIVLLGPPWSGAVSSAAWIASITGIRFVDLDRLVEHRLGCSIPSLASRALENTFRDLQLDILRQELPKTPYGIFVTEDVGFWPTLKGLTQLSHYSLGISPSPEIHYRRFKNRKEDKTSHPFDERPWLADVPETFHGFCQWRDEMQGSSRVANHVLGVDTTEALTLGRSIVAHLTAQGICSEAGV